MLKKKEELKLINNPTNNPDLQIARKAFRDAFKYFLVNHCIPSEENQAAGLHKIILREIEHPLLDILMQFTRGNQTKAAKYMGINRGTLRKKLKEYDLC